MAENAKGTNPFILGITNFTDLSYADFAAKFLMAPQAPPPAKKVKVVGRRLSSLSSEASSRWACGAGQNHAVVAQASAHACRR